MSQSHVHVFQYGHFCRDNNLELHNETNISTLKINWRSQNNQCNRHNVYLPSKLKNVIKKVDKVLLDEKCDSGFATQVAGTCPNMLK